jgi:hypothetical protein
MKAGPHQVAKRIRDELAEEKMVLAHVERDWLKFVETGDDAYLKATAYDLHGFYGGLERIFEAVASTIDGSVPDGESWHRDLLQQMGREMQGIRPALFSEETVNLMDELRRFRHRIRNIYSFNLVPERIKALVEKLPCLSAEANTSLQDFAQFLDRISDPGQ